MENSKTSFFMAVMTDGSAFSEDGDVFPVMASSPVVISDDEEGWGKTPLGEDPPLPNVLRSLLLLR